MPEPTAGELILEGRATRAEDQGTRGETLRRYNTTKEKLELYDPKTGKWVPTKNQAFTVTEDERGRPLATIRGPDGTEWMVPTEALGDDPAAYWEPVQITKPQTKKGYATKELAEAQALPGEVQVQLPDGSWDNVKAPAGAEAGPAFTAPKGYHWQQIGPDPNAPGSWSIVPDGYRLRPKSGPVATDPDTGDLLEPELEWVMEAEARTDIARQPEEAARQGYEWVWDGNQWVEKPIQPSGQFATQEEAAAYATKIGRPDLVPQYDSKTGRFTLATKPKVTAKDLLDQAIVDNDLDAVIRLNDLMNMPTAQERFNMALQYARSPADYQTVLGMMRGELPVQAEGGPFPRAFDTMQQALFGQQRQQAQPGAGAGQALMAAPVTVYGPGGAPLGLPPGSPVPPGYTTTPPQAAQPAAALTPGQAQPAAGTIRYVDRDTGEVLDLPPGVDPGTFPGNWEYQPQATTGPVLDRISPGPGPDLGLTTPSVGPTAPAGFQIPQRTTQEPSRLAFEGGAWMTNLAGETVGVPAEAVEQALALGWTKAAAAPTRTTTSLNLTPAQREAWRRQYGYEPELYLKQAGPEAFRYRLSQLKPRIDLVPPEARTGAVAQQRKLFPEINPDVFRFPSMQTWNQWAIPEQQAFIGKLGELGISGDWLKEYERQWRATTQPAGGRRGRLYTARGLIPSGAIR